MTTNNFDYTTAAVGTIVTTRTEIELTPGAPGSITTRFQKLAHGWRSERGPIVHEPHGVFESVGGTFVLRGAEGVPRNSEGLPYDQEQLTFASFHEEIRISELEEAFTASPPSTPDVE